jgi:hypothetical protein
MALPLIDVAPQNTIQADVARVEQPVYAIGGARVRFELGYGVAGDPAGGGDPPHRKGFDIAHFEQAQVTLGRATNTGEEGLLLNGCCLGCGRISFEGRQQAGGSADLKVT